MRLSGIVMSSALAFVALGQSDDDVFVVGPSSSGGEIILDPVASEDKTMWEQALYHPPQDRFLALADMAVGAAMGLYVPMNLYARNSDCFSLMLARADTFIQWHRYFDNFPYTAVQKARFALTLGLGAYNFYAPGRTCYDQYQNAKTENWSSWYGFMSEAPKAFLNQPVETHHLEKGRTEGGFKPVQDTLMLYNIAVSWMNHNKMKDDKYYWYQKGLYPTRTLSYIMLLTFNIFQDLNIVQPMEPWDRYRNLWSHS